MTLDSRAGNLKFGNAALGILFLKLKIEVFV